MISQGAEELRVVGDEPANFPRIVWREVADSGDGLPQPPSNIAAREAESAGLLAPVPVVEAAGGDQISTYPRDEAGRKAGDPENQGAPGVGMEASQQVLAHQGGCRIEGGLPLARCAGEGPADHGPSGHIAAGPKHNCGSPDCPVCGDFWAQPCGNCGARRDICSC